MAKKLNKVKFGIFEYEWPYSLTVKQIRKVKKLYSKFQKRYAQLIEKHNLCIAIRCTKRTHYPYVGLLVCFARCEPNHGGCKDFGKGVYLCKSLKCSYLIDKNCLSKSPKKRRALCKKIAFYEERQELKKIYEEFILTARIMRGLKLDPLKTIRFIKKRKASGEIKSKKTKRKSEENRKRRANKTKESSKDEKTSRTHTP